MKEQKEQKNVDTALVQIKKVLDSSAGAELKRYFLQQIILLRNVNNVREFTTAEATSAELKAHKGLCSMFEKMMAQIVTWSQQELQEIEKENDYGID